MTVLFDYLRREPVRAYLRTVAVAALTIVAIVAPGLPVPAILALVTAILAVPAGGEVLVRRHVSPTPNVVVHANELHGLEDFGPPDGD